MPTYKNYFDIIHTTGGNLNSAVINCTANSVNGNDYKRNYSDIESAYNYVPGAFNIPNDKITTETEYLVATLINGKSLYYIHGLNNHPSLYTYDENNNKVYFWDLYTNFSGRSDLTFIIVHSDDAVGSYGEYGIYVYSQYQNVNFFMAWNVNSSNMPQWQYLLEGAIPPPEYHNGAGSGYIGNALLSNKKMVGYNVPTSDVESTKTESVNTYSATPTADTPKAGNGFAKITWIRDLTP